MDFRNCLISASSDSSSTAIKWSFIFKSLAVNFQRWGGIAGPAGLAKAGPLFSRSLVSFSECRNCVRTRQLGQVLHASSPLTALLVNVHNSRNRSRSSADGSGARHGPTGLVWTPDPSGRARVWGITLPGSVLLECHGF